MANLVHLQLQSLNYRNRTTEFQSGLNYTSLRTKCASSLNQMQKAQQVGGGRLYNHVSELSSVEGMTTETARTEERGGWNMVKLEVGALH